MLQRIQSIQQQMGLTPGVVPGGADAAALPGGADAAAPGAAPPMGLAGGRPLYSIRAPR